jgi:hypothetical protein
MGHRLGQRGTRVLAELSGLAPGRVAGSVHGPDGRMSSPLARTGRYRAVGIADLLTAVLAAEHAMTVLHDDGDLPIAAEVLAFEHRWVLPRGTA